MCDNPYYVSEDKNGFLFNPNSCKSIADAFLRAFHMKEDELHAREKVLPGKLS